MAPTPDAPLPEGKEQRLDAGIVPIEEFEQLARRSCHATLTSGDRSALGRYLCFHLVAQRFHRGREHVGADTFILVQPEDAHLDSVRDRLVVQQ